ncbi:helix-turn-helix domain-containing protein [Aquimarina sediminis]|uniref:helix-turn-helix domain-containing protein n=1 Tax=Aquimarina sediminis TaxID=2070536 RepID=UPI000C9FFD29|nr:helix-turn-helix domain-containing protein [Aquimarina sediminis]
MTYSITRALSVNISVLIVVFVLSTISVFSQDTTIDTIEQYIQKGNSFYDADQYEKSIVYFDKARAIAKTIKNDTLMCIVDAKKGHAYMLSGKNKEALDAYYTALTISQRIEDLDREMMINSGLILVLKRMNQLDKAYRIALQMIKSIDKTSFINTKNHVNVLTTVSDIYLAREQYDSVLLFSEKGIELSIVLDYKEGLVDFYIKKGMIFYYKKEYDTSLKYLYEAKDIMTHHDIMNRFFPTVNINYFLASCYYEQEVYDKAIDQLFMTINSLEEKDLIKPPVIQSYLLLANCFVEQRDYEKALYWNNEYVKLTENYQKNKDKTINRIYEKEAEKLEREIVNLKREQASSEKSKRYIYVGFVILLVILVGVVYWYFYKQKNNKRRFDDMMEKINHLESHEQKSSIAQTTNMVINDDKVIEVLKKLDGLENQEYFLRVECNLRAVAKKVKTNATYLSRIINTHKEKNFNDYINDLRIDYVVKRLKVDRKFRSFSIKSIATEIGYKSDYSFSKHFKAKTGLNPSYYIRNIEKQEKSMEKTI